MAESLQHTGRADAFHFFILSDSKEPDIYLAEERAWLEVCQTVQGFGRIFYRRRRVPLNHKSGNIADFCRRWGEAYRYMIVLDADSVMTGPTFVRLVELLDHNPQVGIIQSAPQLALGRTLIRRVYQFASRVYGPLYQAGANYWQLGGGTFWGHNAIVRLQPFRRYCALPELPTNALFGRRFFSHDTIEAALMRKANYDVWLAYDLGGSYEEAPPHLPGMLKRDRRWCWGNLQHLWFFFAHGLHSSSRVHIMTGIMSYANAPFWLTFMILSLLLASDHHPNPMTTAHSFYTPGRLFAVVMVLLLLPKVLGLVRLFRSGEALAAYGGRAKVVRSVVAETLFSVILAPILMMFYTQFVLTALLGTTMRWSAQVRNSAAGPTWHDLWVLHGPHWLLALAWGVLTFRLQPSLLPWLLPVLFGLVVAVPFSRLTGSVALGQRAKECGYFLIPEETQPPPELQTLNALPPEADRVESRYGLLEAIADPYTNALHVTCLRPHATRPLQTQQYLEGLRQRLLSNAPDSFTAAETKALLWDADSMIWLHQQLWLRPDTELHPFWQDALHRNA